jgi:4-diphosphocytidyl-2-C-methyl-D-erythritol kinase
MSVIRDEAELAELHRELRRALRAGGELPGGLLVNDLEAPARSLCPSIGTALDAARDAGADHVFVCGSGPTVAGLYWGADGEGRASAAVANLGERFPGACVALPVQRGFGFPLFA